MVSGTAKHNKELFKFFRLVRGKKVKDFETIDKENVCTEVFFVANRAEGIFMEKIDCILIKLNRVEETDWKLGGVFANVKALEAKLNP